MPSNPLQDGLRIEPTPGPTTLVIFGATGDLTRRKLLPAVYNLSRGQRLPARFSVLGVGREPLPDDGLRSILADSLREFAGVKGQDAVAQSLAERMHYVGGDFRDGALFQKIKARLDEIDSAGGALFYLAIPPTIYATVIEQLGAASLSSQPSPERWRRVIVEKPFGSDLATARELNTITHRHFGEDQVYRIDHYLGKETVQNLMVFRFANGMTSDVVTCREDDDVSKAVARMAESKVRRMPVVDGSGTLRGIIAQADIATRVHQDKTTGALVEAISAPGWLQK